MTLRRIESRTIGLVLEWDAETGLTGLAMASDGLGGRSKVFSQLGALQRFLDPLEGISWTDLELSERHKSVCGMSRMALVWRAQFDPADGADVLARTVYVALGGDDRELELTNDEANGELDG